MKFIDKIKIIDIIYQYGIDPTLWKHTFENTYGYIYIDEKKNKYILKIEGNFIYDIDKGFINFSNLKKKENPPKGLKTMAEQAGLPYSNVARYYNEAKKQYLRWTGKKEDELTSRDYQYIMGIVKKRIWYKTGLYKPIPYI
jgi:hypothetical protein